MLRVRSKFLGSKSAASLEQPLRFWLPVGLMSLPRGRLIIPDNGSVGWQLRSEMPFLISARLERQTRTKGAEVSRVRTRGHRNSNRCVAVVQD